jgi:hypothetical protein
MATTYTLNGTATCMGPNSVRWRRVNIGRDHNKRPLFSANWEVDLTFPPASMVWGQEWLRGADSASVNVTVLDEYSIGWRDLSAVQLEVTQYPNVENINFTGFTMVIRGASPA